MEMNESSLKFVAQLPEGYDVRTRLFVIGREIVVTHPEFPPGYLRDGKIEYDIKTRP